MKRSALLVVPALCALLLACGASASAVPAMPVVADPLVSLPGSAPTAVVPTASGGFFALNSGLDSVIEYDAGGQQHGAMGTALLPSGSKSSAMISDQYGSLYVANPGTHSVSRVKTSTGMIVPFALPLADVPVSLAISATRDVFVTKANDQVARISPTDVVTLEFAKLPAGSDPRGVAVDAAGNVYTANFASNTISKISPMGAVVEYAALGLGNGPTALVIDKHGMLSVANTIGNSVMTFDTSKPAGTAPAQKFSVDFGATPVALAVDEFGDVFIANLTHKSISVAVPGATFARTVIYTLSGSPASLAIASDNKLLVAVTDKNSVSSIDLETRIGTSTIGPLTVGATFSGAAAATGVGDITFSSPDLPAWLTLDPTTGALTGTPLTPGQSSFTLRALSSLGRSDARTVRFEVSAAPVVTPSPTATPAPTTTGGAAGGRGSGTGSGSDASGGSGSGSGGRGATSLASTGVGDVAPWGIAGSALMLVGLVGLVGLAASSRRRARRGA